MLPFPGKKQETPFVVHDADGLMALVGKGDIAELRRYFDQSLRGLDIVRPAWEHLHAALRADNRGMQRLLVTWGAAPPADILQGLSAEDIARLRMAGLPLGPAPTGGAPKKTVLTHELAIPSTWRAVLRGFQRNGAPEAMIVGGALRDLDHDRPINDVDIFVRTSYISGKSEKALMARAFAAAEQKIVQRPQHYTGSYGRAFSMMEDFIEARGLDGNAYRDIALGVTHAYVAVAGLFNTHYNIIFVDSPLMSRMRRDAKRTDGADTTAARLFIDKLDIGLCQIAYNGRQLLTTPHYHRDSEKRTLTAMNPGMLTDDHILRVADKYRDFKPDAMLAPRVERLRDQAYYRAFPF